MKVSIKVLSVVEKWAELEITEGNAKRIVQGLTVPFPNVSVGSKYIAEKIGDAYLNWRRVDPKT